MATQRPGFATPLAEFAAALLAEREVAPRAQLIAEMIAQNFPGAAAVVYVIEDQEAPQWTARATAGDINVGEPVVEFGSGTLGTIAENRQALLFSGADLAREDYAHLDVRRTVASVAYVPLIANEVLVGAVEVITYDQPLAESALDPLIAAAEIGALGVANALAYENERNSGLQSITRVTQMYDLEKVFNSTLEMEQLLGTISAKFQEVMNVQAVNLWMVAGDGVQLVSQYGADPTIEMGSTQKPGEGIAGDLSEGGEALLISDPEDPRLRRRNGDVEEGAIFSLLAAPLISDESLVGVVEAINRLDGIPFDEDDQFLLSNICETASNALHNASLLQAERKVEILQALVKVSQEITSTLNMQRVLQTIVNGPQEVIPYERAAMALEQHGKLGLKAVSGAQEIPKGDPSIERLDEMLQWASFLNEEIHITEHEGEIDDPREETQAKFRDYFAATGMKGFYALPLTDEQGRVGILSLESSDPDFLTSVHVEMIKVVAGQATVALRNAELYKEVPFIGLLEPVLEKKRKFMAMETHRRRATIGVAALAVLFLAVFPLPMRVDGDATVEPARTANVQPEVDGVVKNVYVVEGQPVQAGTVLADLEDWDYRAALAEAQANYQTALSKMDKALANNDGGEAGVQRIQADYWSAEVGRAKERLEKTHLRSPIAGAVATPHIENLVGKHLDAGDNFAQVLDTRSAMVDVGVDEKDAPLLEPGESARVKLDGFPMRTFQGKVAVVSPQSEASGDQRVYFARVSVPNPQGFIRAGMQGRAKVWTSWRPSGYVLFRRPFLWITDKLWSLLGW